MKWIVAMALLIPSASFAAEASRAAPSQPVTVVLSVQDLQAVLVSVQDSAHLSARDANRICQAIFSQVQPQLTPLASTKSSR